MPKLKDVAQQNKKRLMLVVWAVLAAIAGITAVTFDDELCQQFDGCKAAYDAGTPAPDVSATTVQ